jgi:presenilin-like A22 family membrane protease
MTSRFPPKLGKVPTLELGVQEGHVVAKLPVWIQIKLDRYRLLRVIGNTCVVLSFLGACFIAVLAFFELFDPSSNNLTSIVVVGVISLLLFVVACVLGPFRAKLRPTYVQYSGRF